MCSLIAGTPVSFQRSDYYDRRNSGVTIGGEVARAAMHAINRSRSPCWQESSLGAWLACARAVFCHGEHALRIRVLLAALTSHEFTLCAMRFAGASIASADSLMCTARSRLVRFRSSSTVRRLRSSSRQSLRSRRRMRLPTRTHKRSSNSSSKCSKRKKRRRKRSSGQQRRRLHTTCRRPLSTTRSVHSNL